MTIQNILTHCACLCSHVMFVLQCPSNRMCEEQGWCKNNSTFYVLHSRDAKKWKFDCNGTSEMSKTLINSAALTVVCDLREVLSANNLFSHMHTKKKWSASGNPDEHNRWYKQYKDFVASWQQFGENNCQAELSSVSTVSHIKTWVLHDAYNTNGKTGFFLVFLLFLHKLPDPFSFKWKKVHFCNELSRSFGDNNTRKDLKSEKKESELI